MHIVISRGSLITAEAIHYTVSSLRRPPAVRSLPTGEGWERRRWWWKDAGTAHCWEAEGRVPAEGQ